VAKKLSDIQAKEMKAIVDDMKDKYKDNVIIALFAANEGKASVVIGVSDDVKDKVSAVDLVKKVASYVGAQGGGGRPDMAQTGGTDCSRFDEAIAEIRNSL
jgi:alanyl-tRNA synthetase